MRKEEGRIGSGVVVVGVHLLAVCCFFVLALKLVYVYAFCNVASVKRERMNGAKYDSFEMEEEGDGDIAGFNDVRFRQKTPLWKKILVGVGALVGAALVIVIIVVTFGEKSVVL